MMFQPYKLHFHGVRFNSTYLYTYTYKKCSICVSNQNRELAVSIVPHDFEKKPVLPEWDELSGLLTYLGINISKPYQTFSVPHYNDPGFGDTHYFVQEGH